MADRTISDEDFRKHFRPFLSGKYHPLVEKYGKVLSQAMACKGEERKWRKEFDKLETDFDRAFFILKALESFNKEEKGICVLGLPPAKEASKFLTTGKSDAIAKKCLSMSDKFYRERNFKRALVAINRAYFAAVSKEVKYHVLLKRIRLIKKFNVDEVLEEEIGLIIKNKTSNEKTQSASSVREDIERIIDFQLCQGRWISVSPDSPKSLNGKTLDDPVKMERKKFKFVPINDDSEQLRNENSEMKYTAVASRNISIGRTKVGFCSDKCANDARTPIGPSNGGSGRHVHDCGGILPCLRVDDLFENDIFMDQGLAHLGFNCIANTPANILLNCICSSVGVITGYPMKWFSEAREHFYSPPSSTNQPDWIPASWIVAQMITHIASNNFNSKGYVEYYEERKELNANSNKIGCCVYPIISLLSHDCNPNACIVNTANGCAFVYALRTIKEGEKISITYGPSYFSTTSANLRRFYLREIFAVNCSCEACRTDWSLKKRDFEILKCPLCESSFRSNNEKCLSCKKPNGIGRECAPEVITAMEEVQRLISSPSPTVAFVLSAGMQAKIKVKVKNVCITLEDMAWGISSSSLATN
ncbi:unnamed protein product [Rodentolepis nana]|uniref:SET domain-containing protein n=1 Tax=Rodentolepis nana TaxID=102285 RepID=A0A0R3T082_RODNA|nr:unnamed protein product [Rodentolepis nana]